jgi:hypothetical protein
MKTGIKKIALLTAALIFLGTGISFAHDRPHRAPGHAYGRYKQKGHPVWNKKHHGPKWRYQKHHAHRYVDRHHRDFGHYRHGSGYNGWVVKFAVADENVAFKIVVKDFERR